MFLKWNIGSRDNFITLGLVEKSVWQILPKLQFNYTDTRTWHVELAWIKVYLMIGQFRAVS